MTNVLDFNDLRTVKIKTLWGQIAHSSTNPSLTRWLKSIHTYILLTGKYDLQVRGEKLHSYDICEAGIFFCCEAGEARRVTRRITDKEVSVTCLSTRALHIS